MGIIESPFVVKERSRILKEVRAELRFAPDRRFRTIVRAYEELPFYLRHFNLPWLNQSLWYKRDLRYSVSKAILEGKFSWEELEKKEEEERLRIREEEEKEKVRKERIERAERMDLFPGSLSEYEHMKGEKYQIIKVETRDNLVFYYDKYPDRLEKLGAMDIDGLIRFRHLESYFLEGYGIPVRKAKRN